jgi:hypothetical protein
MIAEILAVHFEEIERAEARPVATEQQSVKQAPSVVPEAHELAVQDRPHRLDATRDFLAEQVPLGERVAAAGYQAAARHDEKSPTRRSGLDV